MSYHQMMGSPAVRAVSLAAVLSVAGALACEDDISDLKRYSGSPSGRSPVRRTVADDEDAPPPAFQVYRLLRVELGPKETVAVLEDLEEKEHEVRIGDVLPGTHAKVDEISPAGITVIEIRQDTAGRAVRVESSFQAGSGRR